MAKHFLIAATGTEIGKTVITCGLCHQLTQAKTPVHAIKPVISGWKNKKNSDTHQLLISQHKGTNNINIDQTSPWRFKAPLSPDIAAQKENKNISFTKVVEFCQQAITKHNEKYVFIETAGGIMTPINKTHTFLDLAQQLQLPVILITAPYLGTISHTLTTLYTLQNVGLTVPHIIFNTPKKSKISAKDTQNALSSHTSVPITKINKISEKTLGNVWQHLPNLIHLVTPQSRVK